MSPIIGGVQAVSIAAQAAPSLARLKKTTLGIESIFVKQLLTEMRKSVPDVSMGDSFGKDIYDDLMDQVLADTTAQTGNFGMAKMLTREFTPQIVAQVAANVRLSSNRSAPTTSAGAKDSRSTQ